MAEKTLKNGSILEVTSTNFSVSSESIKPRSNIRTGKLNEKKRFTITGRAELNKPTNIGVLKLSADENKRFLRAPNIRKVNEKNIVLNSKIALRLENVEKDSKNRITSYLYNIIYTGKESVTKLNPLKYKLSNRTISLVSKIIGIDKVDCGANYLNLNGEKRRITIHGTPGSIFKIAVTRIEESKYDNFNTDSGIPGGGGRNPVVQGVETDILNSAYGNSTENLSPTGAEMSIIRDKIGADGKYSFMQEFPKLELVRATAVNGSMAASGTTKIIFDNLDDVTVGDLVTINGLTTTVQTLNPDTDNVNECDLTNSMTAADNTHAEFRRVSKYSINIKPVNPAKFKNKKSINYLMYGRRGWRNGWYSKIIEHLYKPSLIIRATTNSVLYTINRDTIPGGASTQTYDRRFRSRRSVAYDGSETYNKRGDYYTITYTLRALSNSHSFSVLKTPVFSNVAGGTSDFSNSFRSTNGGTWFDIQNRVSPVLSNTQGWANDTATITFNLKTLNYGSTDVVSTFNLNAMVGCS